MYIFFLIQTKAYTRHRVRDDMWDVKCVLKNFATPKIGSFVEKCCDNKCGPGCLVRSCLIWIQLWILKNNQYSYSPDDSFFSFCKCNIYHTFTRIISQCFINLCSFLIFFQPDIFCMFLRPILNYCKYRTVVPCDF